MAVDRANLPEGLLSDIKNYLQILWDDPATNDRVTNIIAGGMVYLNTKLGTEADYTVDGIPRNLLQDYCRYARDGALDVFENNYLALILAARDDIAITAAAQGAGT